jgi:Mrp family chromosome partitioning ATPase
MAIAHDDTTKAAADDRVNAEESHLVRVKPKEQGLVRVPRSIVFHPTHGRRMDNEVVNFRYYNSFNYSLLSKEKSNFRLTLGVTSPNPREGKTLVASNLAVSLTLGYRKRTVLVDMNVARPRLHEIFGTPVGPGLIDALHDGPVSLVRTQIEHLSVLAVGNLKNRRSNGETINSHSFVGLEYMAAFGDIIYSLQQEFEFVIVDMPSINTRDFPILFANQLDGLLVVVDAGKTKREDLEKMFRQVNERQVLGFVFNRVRDEKP